MFHGILPCKSNTELHESHGNGFMSGDECYWHAVIAGRPCLDMNTHAETPRSHTEAVQTLVIFPNAGRSGD